MDQKKDIQIKKWDWLLIIGLSIAPMTGLRIWKVGPAEMLCLIWSIKHLYHRCWRINDLIKFCAIYLASMIFGYLHCLLMYPDELDKTGLLTWVYLFSIAIGIHNGLKNNSKKYNETILYLFAYVAVTISFLLYIYSILVSKIFLGAPLWYYDVRYSSGGTNPHQIACLLCGLICLFFIKILRKENVILNIAFVIIAFFLLFQTKSSTGLMAAFVGVFIGLLLYIVNHNSKNKIKYLFITFLSFTLLVIIGYSFFFELFMNWVASDENGAGRLEIFSSFPIVFWKSPIFGLGPGEHACNGTIEFHNTYLEILATTGIVGFIDFLVFSARTFFKSLKTDYTYLSPLIAIYAFGLSGFAMRRLVYWGIFTIILVISDTYGIEQKDINNQGLYDK